jgi:hypothetical protein
MIKTVKIDSLAKKKLVLVPSLIEGEIEGGEFVREWNQRLWSMDRRYFRGARLRYVRRFCGPLTSFGSS